MDAPRIAVAGTWAATLVAVLLVAAAAPAERAPGLLALVLGLSVVVGMVGQLAAGQQRGFVARLSTAACGSFVLVLAGALAVVLRG